MLPLSSESRDAHRLLSPHLLDFEAYAAKNMSSLLDSTSRLNAHAFMTLLSEYLCDHCQDLSDSQLKGCAEVIERLLRSSYKTLPNAVAVCFLETIKNTVAHKRLAPFLGPESRAFIEATPWA